MSFGQGLQAILTKINFPKDGFPRKGQILPAPGRNVTVGDKEGNGCHRRGLMMAQASGSLWEISLIRLLTAFADTFTKKDGQNAKRNIAAHHEKQGSGL